MDSTNRRNCITAGIVCALLIGCGSSGDDANVGAPDTGLGGSAGNLAGSSGTRVSSDGKANTGGALGQRGGEADMSSMTSASGGATGKGGFSLVSSSGGAGNGAGGAGGTLVSAGGTGGTLSGGRTGGKDSVSLPGGTSASGGAKTGGTSGGGGTKTGGTAASGGLTSTGGTTTSAGGTTATTGSTGPLPSLTIYVAGDSTVSNYTDTAATNDQAGWGQMLREIFNSKVTIDNRAAGGRTAYWFYLEGAAGKILSAIKPGDYFFIQFGTNDQNETATFTVDGKQYKRYAEASTTFKTHLKQYYLDPTKAKQAIPVLVTPPPRNSAYCNGGNGLGAYATAMIELGAAENVAVLDNNGKTHSYLKAICPKPTTAAAETFFFGKADGSIDSTHFQENGARKMAGFIGEEIKRLNLGLAAYLK